MDEGKHSEVESKKKQMADRFTLRVYYTTDFNERYGRYILCLELFLIIVSNRSTPEIQGEVTNIIDGFRGVRKGRTHPLNFEQQNIFYAIFINY